MDEFSLIHRYFKRDTPHTGVRLGIGDDAALLTPPAHHELAISTDTLVAGRHFPRDTDAYSIGWKAAAVNLSDLAAMGATPHSLLLALTLPNADPDFLQQLAAGLFAACDAAGVALIGGDTTRGDCLSLTITALGWVPNGQAILRSGAKVDDLIVVSGTLGDAAYALQHLADAQLAPALKARLDQPTPRNALGIQLRGLASAMLDISDGLAQDLGHILQASAVCGVVHVEHLPCSPELAALDVMTRAPLQLAGGDDYELCFTISAANFATLQGLWQGHELPLTVIGQITRGATALGPDRLAILHDYQPFTLSQQGFKHFD